jgi:hypothetical protein
MNARPRHARPRRARGAALLAATLALAHAPPAARAQQPAPAPPGADGAREARERFQRGVELYKEGDFRAALVEFRRAYEIAPNFVVLFNIGQANYELQDYAGAKGSFEAYLREGGAAVPADRRRAVEAELARLASRVAHLDVRANVEGAEVLVDDVPAGKTPLPGPLVVSAGRRKVTVVKAPAPAVTRYVDVAGGLRERVEVDLSAPRAEAPAPPRPAEPPPPPPVSNAPVWVGLATTGVLAGGAAAAGVLTLGAQRRLDDRLDRAPTDAEGVGGFRDDVRRLSLATDVAAGAAAVAGGVTLYLFLSRRGGRARQGRSPAAGFALAPRGLAFGGHF